MSGTGILRDVSGVEVYAGSVTSVGDAELGFARVAEGERLVVVAPAGSQVLNRFHGQSRVLDQSTLLVCPKSAANLAALKEVLPWLKPRTLGLATSAGFGDRLGMATPGHIRAMKVAGVGVAPIFAQQSIREMERTGRSAQEVIDDASWGVFAGGWQGNFGADADHLKTPDDIDQCVAAGYTFFTFDPGEHVDDSVEETEPAVLRAAVAKLPWGKLEDSMEGMTARYLGRTFEFEEYEVSFDEVELYKSAVKYGRAVAHATTLYRHLSRVASGLEFEVEVSVDETATPTTHAQHLYIASELRRLGVEWVSLAPRYVGEFEKGVDYIGSVGEFEADFAVHAAIARRFGPYKLSLHSGSDKFSIYPAAVRQARGLVHLKTAGTSYLEALRTIAGLDPEFFREIYQFARERYEADRASYHVSASLEKAPTSSEVANAELPALLEQFDAREILHVTFGSVLMEPQFRTLLMRLLRSHPEAYEANLENHFVRHLEPFARKVSGADA